MWDFTSKILYGATYPLQEISTEERDKDLAFSLSRGNHKSVIENKTIIRDLLQEDIIRGFSLVLPTNILPHLQHVSISPVGCQQQDTINETAEMTTQHLLTHYQSFPGLSVFSPISEFYLNNSHHVNMVTA